jgi:hypothetical protein
VTLRFYNEKKASMIELISVGKRTCFKCKFPLKEGDEIHSVPYDCRHPVYKKKNKKLKGDKVLYFHTHVKCPGET